MTISWARNDGIRGIGIKLYRVRVLMPQDIASPGDGHNLHAQTKSEIRNFSASRIISRQDHAFRAPLAETSRNNDAVQIIQFFEFALVSFVYFRIQPYNIRFITESPSGVIDGLYHRNIGIFA